MACLIAGWNMNYLKEYLQFKMMIFHCYVSFPAGMSDVFLLKFQRFSAPGEFDNVKPKSLVQSCFSHRRKSFVMFAKIHPVSLLWLHLKGHDSKSPQNGRFEDLLLFFWGTLPIFRGESC